MIEPTPPALLLNSNHGFEAFNVRPRRASTAFNFFFAEERRRLLIEQPGLGFAQVCRMVREKWHALPAEYKEEYHGLAHEDAIRYQMEMEAYRARHQPQREEVDVPDVCSTE